MSRSRSTVLRLAVIGLLLAMGTATAAAQSTVKIPICAVDEAGQPVPNLPGVEFRVSQAGQSLRLTHYWGPESPVLIVLALDTTGNLTWIDTLRDHLIRFVRNLPPNVQMMVVTVHDGIRVVQNNTSERELLVKAIQYYSIAGRPGFLENVLSLQENVDRILRQHPMRVATLYVTDSDLYGYRRRYSSSDLTTTVERIQDKLEGFSAPIFVLRLPPPAEQIEVRRSGSSADGSPIDPDVIQNTAPEEDPADGGPASVSEARTNNEYKARRAARDGGDPERMRRTYEGALRQIARETGGEAAFPLSLSGVSSGLAELLQRIHATCIVGCDTRSLASGKTYDVDVQAVEIRPAADAPPIPALRLEFKKRIRVAGP